MTTEEKREKAREYRKSEAYKKRQYEHQERWRIKNKKKVLAHAKVHKAIDAGRLERPNLCNACLAEGKPQAHHFDYDKPFDVMWLCEVCHKSLHSRLRSPNKVDYDFALKTLENVEQSPLAKGTDAIFPSKEQYKALTEALAAWKAYQKAAYNLYNAYTERTNDDQ